MNVKKRLFPSVLAGFAFAFTFVFYGAFEIYLGNKEEFAFHLFDFLPGTLLLFFTAFAVICGGLLLARGRVFHLLFALVTGLTVAGYLEGNFLAFGSAALRGDDVGDAVAPALVALDLAIWILLIAAALFAGWMIKKKAAVRSVLCFLLILVAGMQLANFAVYFGVAAQPKEGTPTSGGYLTDVGIHEIGREKNVTVFILDRFDVSYYKELINADPDFFAPLDGFTYYEDNISTYSRTYPAITSMLTGILPDFEKNADDYFTDAYQSSPFLNDLKQNGYRIGIYADSYYTYREADSLDGIAENLSYNKRYTISEPSRLVGNMEALSLYRYLPHILKSRIQISSTSFAGLIEYDDTAKRYELDDYAYATDLRENGLSLAKNSKTFSCIHLNGFHEPNRGVDEEGNKIEGSGKRQEVFRGCVSIVFRYIEELKRLGLYEEATIIITGDHPSALSDSRVPTQPRQTALFVKEAGQVGTPLAYSSAQVSQDNLIPTIVASEGLLTENRYGRPYSSIGEGENVTRYHLFQRSEGNRDDKITRFEITGIGSDFTNWRFVSETDIGYLYK